MKQEKLQYAPVCIEWIRFQSVDIVMASPNDPNNQNSGIETPIDPFPQP